MQYFLSDYMEGAHPLILERLMQTNMEKTPGYGTDHYCAEAREKIRQACGCPGASVHFLVGGTQTNATVITSVLRPYEGVIAAESGHINQHEAGAVEAGGHKVLGLPHCNGKLAAKDVDRYITEFYAGPSWDHMVAPAMVYISHPTEYGTLYTLEELRALSVVCRKHQIPLFLDGARLGYGLAAHGTDVTLKDIAALCDIFYIGGTKVGALFGEAVVFTHPGLVKQFDTIVKQRGVLLAKGRLLGLQFDTLFTDDLYIRIARHAIDMADRIVSALREKGYRFLIEPETNQLFVIMENRRLEELSKTVGVEVWEKVDEDHTAVRIATSWATREEDVAVLIGQL